MIVEYDKDVNQIDLPLFLRQFTCKKTIQKIKLADIPYNNNSFIYTNPSNTSQSIQNRTYVAAHANDNRKSANEQSLEIKVDLNSSPDSPKQDVPDQDAAEKDVPEQDIPAQPVPSQLVEPIERTTSDKSNSDQGLVYCFLFYEHCDISTRLTTLLIKIILWVPKLKIK